MFASFNIVTSIQIVCIFQNGISRNYLIDWPNTIYETSVKIFHNNDWNVWSLETLVNQDQRRLYTLCSPRAWGIFWFKCKNYRLHHNKSVCIGIAQTLSRTVLKSFLICIWYLCFCNRIKIKIIKISQPLCLTKQWTFLHLFVTLASSHQWT